MKTNLLILGAALLTGSLAAAEPVGMPAVPPKIVAYAGEQCEQEGCLSLPGKWGKTRRPMHVTVRAQGLDGEEVEYTGSDLLARAFCHELDHLDGKLFTDSLVGELEG